MLDCVGDEESLVVVYSNTSQGLMKRQFTTTEKVERVTLLPAGECVCTTDMPHSRIVMFNREGDQVWSKSLPCASPDAATYPVLLRATPSGLIIVCDLNTHRVTVLDATGNQLREFPPDTIERPYCMCVDTEGDVLIYDDAKHAVSLFSIDGTYIKKILTTDVGFGVMSLFQDRYMLCKNTLCGLYLYEL